MSKANPGHQEHYRGVPLMFPTNVVPFSPEIHQKKTLSAATASGVVGVVPPWGQAPISCPPELVMEGIDTLYLSFQAEIPQELIALLKDKKTEVQGTSDDCLFLPFGQTSLFSFNLQRTGVKFFPYVLKTGDFTLFISNRDEKSTIPNMQVTVGSLSCNNGLDQLLETFGKWCRHHKIDIKSEKVSRIDLFADLQLDMNDLRLWNQARMVTRAEKVALYYSNREITGLQVGSGEIVLRIYDKIQEMTDKCSVHKMDFFKEKWGKPVDNVTRVEFQLRRAAIKSLCPIENDFKAVKGKIKNIWKYLTSEWFRQTAKAVDRLNRNQSRETISDFWYMVQRSFSSFCSDACLRNKKLKTINVQSLIVQAAGIMKTVCAAMGHAHDDLFGIFSTSAQLIQDKILESMDEPGFERDFNRRVACSRVSF